LWRERRWNDSPGFFFACWALFPVLFFSLSQSKLPSYVLPAIPPLALVCSVGFLRSFDRSRETATRLAGSIAGTCVAVVVIALYAARRIDWNAVITNEGAQLMPLFGYAALGVTTLMAAGLVVAAYRKNLPIAVGLCALWVALSVEASSLRLLPFLDYFYSARPHAEFMRNDRRPDRIFTYQLRRNWNYGLAFYFRRELPEWSPSDPQPALVLTTPEGAKQIGRLGRIGGLLDEHYAGILYVPVTAARVSRQ
jgi:4-amino-4-deoxy-L-arabinose transferase-like glycosyltransferase